MFKAMYLRPHSFLLAALPFFAVLNLSASSALAAPATTTTALSVTSGGAAATSAAFGAAVTLTATVKAGSTAVALGQVNFCDATAAHCTDIHIVGTAQLTSAGTAALKLVPPPGSHSYRADFPGTAADAASASSASPLTVDDIPTTTAIAQSGSPGNYTLKATIAGNGVQTSPTGTVSFLDTSKANAVLGTATLGTGASALAWIKAQAQTTKPEPQSIVVLDFNGDGIPDLAVGTNGTTATGGTGYIDILLGNGDGTFQKANNVPALGNNHALAVAAFVDGGPMDILTVSNSTSAVNNAAILFGGGTSVNFPFSLPLSSVSAAATGDFNRDGKQDFVVAGQEFGVDALAVFLGNGNGTFGTPTIFALGSASISSVVVADFNGDGKPDLAAVSADKTVTVLLGDGIGDFSPGSTSFSTGSSPSAMVVGDFNGDGKPDLAIANSGDDTVTVLLGKGDGTFTTAASPATGHAPISLAIGDFNSDGIVDLAVVNSTDDSVTVLLGKGNGTFAPEAATLPTGTGPYSIIAGNFHGYGTTDLAVANEDTGSTASSTVSMLHSQWTQTAIAAATGIAPSGSGTHLVEASYLGNSSYSASVSTKTSLTGTVSQAIAPVLSPAAGTYTSAQKVTLTDATPGATVYYSTNGTAPTATSSKYSAPIPVSTSETIEAIAVAAGYTDSIVAKAAYKIIGSPSALSAPATSINTPNAALNALVNTLGLTGSYIFQYGTSSTALTASTAKTALGASTNPVAASAKLTTLKAKTTYYFHVVVTTAGGTSSSSILSFTTN